MNDATAGWNELGNRLSALGLKLKLHWGQAQSDDDEAAQAALRRLADAIEDAFDAVGNAAKESVVTWVESRGGTCPLGALDVSQCSGANLDPRTRLIGVVHPGGAGQGGDAP